MNKPHKHADAIKAWANGAIIQYWRTPYGWEDCSDNNPAWCKDMKYRIKPEVKADFSISCRVDAAGIDLVVRRSEQRDRHNLRLTFDGETGYLKEAYVL